MIDLEKMAHQIAQTAGIKYSESLGTEYVNRKEIYREALEALRTVEREARREALTEMLAEYECLEERMGCCGEAMCDWRKSLEVMLEQSK